MNIYKSIITIAVLFSFSLFNTLGAQVISSKELMHNIEPINEPLSSILKLEPIQYEYNTGDYKYLGLPAGQYYGFDAQEVQKVFPGIVRTDHKMYLAGKNFYKSAAVKTIDYEKFIPFLIASLKQQQAEIQLLKQEVQRLKDGK